MILIKICDMAAYIQILIRKRLLFFTNFGHNYHFLFFLGEKVSSGIWETCSKLLGGYVYQNAPYGGEYIYISLYLSQYNRNYLAKIYHKSKNTQEQNVLRIRIYICCANFITIGEPPIVFHIYIYICKL